MSRVIEDRREPAEVPDADLTELVAITEHVGRVLDRVRRALWLGDVPSAADVDQLEVMVLELAERADEVRT